MPSAKNACAQKPSVQVKDIHFATETVSVPVGQKEAAAGNLTGDEHPDVLLAVNDSVSILRGDFIGDGVDAAAITCWNAEEVLLLLGGPDSIQTATLPVTGNAWGPAAADFNGDGIDDLIIPDASSTRAAAFVSRAE